MMKVQKCRHCDKLIGDVEICPFCGFSLSYDKKTAETSIEPITNRKKTINFDIEARKLKPVYLNRGGKIVGGVYAVGSGYPILTYMSSRKNNHFFINHRGFGIQRSILKSIFDRSMYKGGEIKLIIIKYDGVKGRRYFVSKPDDWIMHGIPACHTKEVDDIKIETYGDQTVLCQDYMEEWVLDNSIRRKD